MCACVAIGLVALLTSLGGAGGDVYSQRDGACSGCAEQTLSTFTQGCLSCPGRREFQRWTYDYTQGEDVNVYSSYWGVRCQSGDRTHRLPSCRCLAAQTLLLCASALPALSAHVGACVAGC